MALDLYNEDSAEAGSQTSEAFSKEEMLKLLHREAELVRKQNTVPEPVSGTLKARLKKRDDH